MAFKWSPVDTDLADSNLRRLKKEQEDAEKPRVPMLYLKNGNTTLWVLPPYEGSSSWFNQVKEHAFKIEDKLYYKKCLDQAGTNRDDCPLCIAASELYEKGGELNVKRSSDLRPSIRGFLNVLVLSAPSETKFEAGKVYVAKVAKTIITGLLDYDRDIQNPLQTHDITGSVHYQQDPNQGLAGIPMIVERTGRGLGTRYNVKAGGVRIRLEDQLETSGFEGGIDDLELYDLTEACPDVVLSEMEDLANQILGSTSGPVPREVAPPIATMAKATAVPGLPDPPQ